jgi:hypothetical protein
MGKLFTLDDETKALVRDAFDDVLAEFGKPCLLVYPPRWKNCVNCVLTPGAPTSNRWKTGGPMPFPNGSACPMCNGEGRRAEEVTEQITLLCAWEPRSFFYPVPGIELRAPYSVLQTKCFMSDAPKLMRADHLVFQVPVEGVARKKFKLEGAPGDASNIIQSRYCVSLWVEIP